MADLFGTYDHRAKITIDHTLIPSDLAWFPHLVKFNSTDHPELFAELTSDPDFDRVAFTTSDEETQIYADCELFDTTNGVAIYHVSKTGWTISSSADTDIYLYYDNTADHNTTYISKSGDTAAQSVWDSSFKAVYHMNDVELEEPTYDVEYDGSVEPDSDGWTLGGTDYASSDGDILTIDTSADDTYTCYYYKRPDVDFDAGFYLKLRMKLDSAMGSGDYIELQIRDGSQNERAYVNWYHSYGGNQTVRLYGSSGYTNYTTNTSDDYHIYEIYVKGTDFSVYKDGSLLGTKTVDTGTYNDWVEFGDSSLEAAGKAYIDYLNYALDIGYNPAAGIIDSTSNANHGTKKASGEPAEATGLVGKGQDFDGTDDYITTDGAYNDTSFMISILVNPDDTTINQYIAHGKGESTVNKRSVILGYQDGYFNFYNEGYPTGDAADTQISATQDTWQLITYGGDGTDFYGYKDGTNIVDVTASINVTDMVEYAFGIYGIDTPRWYNGIIDEVRISSTARSAAWLAATNSSLRDLVNTIEFGTGEQKESTSTIGISTAFAGVLSKGASEQVAATVGISTLFDSILSKGITENATSTIGVSTQFDGILSNGFVQNAISTINIVTQLDSLLSKGKTEQAISIFGISTLFESQLKKYRESTTTINISTLFVSSLSKGLIEQTSATIGISTLFESVLSKGKIQNAILEISIATQFDGLLNKGVIENALSTIDIQTLFNAELGIAGIKEATSTINIQTGFDTSISKGKIENAISEIKIDTQFTANLDKGKTEQAISQIDIDTDFEVILSKGTIEQTSATINTNILFGAKLGHQRIRQATGTINLNTELLSDLSRGRLEQAFSTIYIATDFEGFISRAIKDGYVTISFSTLFEGIIKRQYHHTTATLGITRNPSEFNVRKIEGEFDIINQDTEIKIIE